MEVRDGNEVKPYWRIPIKVIVKFLAKNINRIITAFEYVYGLGEKNFVNWKYIKIIIMFLRFLKYAYGNYLLRNKSAL